MIQDLYTKKRSLELKWEQEHLAEGRYTLEMVKIDDKVRESSQRSNWKKQKKPTAQNTIEGAAPQVSVAT